jgi:hypothetical protein
MSRVTGTLHLRTQTVTLANGEIRDVFHTNFDNTTGTGLTTGTTYRATSAESAAESLGDMLADRCCGGWWLPGIPGGAWAAGASA